MGKGRKRRKPGNRTTHLERHRTQHCKSQPRKTAQKTPHHLPDCGSRPIALDRCPVRMVHQRHVQRPPQGKRSMRSRCGPGAKGFAHPARRDQGLDEFVQPAQIQQQLQPGKTRHRTGRRSLLRGCPQSGQSIHRSLRGLEHRSPGDRIQRERLPRRR